jgi:uncharacterized protein YbjT (DUF2867 family)
MQNTVLVAGATGNLGGQIVAALLAKGAKVRIVVRPTSNAEKVKAMQARGAEVVTIEFADKAALAKACEGVLCVVSALSGLRDTIIDTQKLLLDAAVAAGVPRFIPSDYSLDFTPFSAGENRNLDWRREFHTYLDAAPIAATSIFNGAFADMLTAEMPLILFKQNKIFFWGNPNQPMIFTTVANIAEYTANVALDSETPRFLHIAGDKLSAAQVKDVATQATGRPFGFLRPGGLGFFDIMIKITRFFVPGKTDLYPPWQGMQYMRNMLDARSKTDATDKHRYPNMAWTTVQDIITAHEKK